MTSVETGNLGYLTTSEAESRYGIGAAILRKLFRLGMLNGSFVTPGGHRRYSRAGIEAYIAANAKKAPVPAPAPAGGTFEVQRGGDA